MPANQLERVRRESGELDSGLKNDEHSSLLEEKKLNPPSLGGEEEK